jgi:hypothetical protein
MDAWIARALGLAMLVSSVAWATTLPTAAELRSDLAPFLAKPLPSMASVVGIAMPSPSPMVVVASFGDPSLPADGDRGYALGRTLNELLFGAHGELDVETPSYYSLDTREPGAPVGRGRDSRANAYRVAAREGAQWCVYGSVKGSAGAYMITVTIDRCTSGSMTTDKVFSVRSDEDWPRTLRDICEHVIAVAAKSSSRSEAACTRGAAVRPQTFLAYASYATTSGMPRERLQVIVTADPKFAPTAMELIERLPQGADKAAFHKQVEAIVTAAGATPAVAMVGFARQLANSAWKLEHRPFDRLLALIRAHPELRSPWLLLASSLSQAVTWDYPNGNVVVDWVAYYLVKFHMGWEGALYYPNESTHTVALAVSLDYYANWPESYRARWQIGYATLQYALMLRGIQMWPAVPHQGKVAFKPLMAIADDYVAAALAMQPGATSLWINRIVTLKHSGGDWLATFDAAAAKHPQAPRVYETAMNFAQGKWGGDEADRLHVQNAAIRNNPDAEWARTLIDRHGGPGMPDGG